MVLVGSERRMTTRVDRAWTERRGAQAEVECRLPLSPAALERLKCVGDGESLCYSRN